MPVRLVVDVDKLTVGDLLMLEDAQNNNLRQVRDLLAGYVVGDNDEPLTPEEGKAAINSLTMGELKGAIESFTEQLSAMSESAVPK